MTRRKCWLGGLAALGILSWATGARADLITSDFTVNYAFTNGSRAATVVPINPLAAPYITATNIGSSNVTLGTPSVPDSLGVKTPANNTGQANNNDNYIDFAIGLDPAFGFEFSSLVITAARTNVAGPPTANAGFTVRTAVQGVNVTNPNRQVNNAINPASPGTNYNFSDYSMTLITPSLLSGSYALRVYLYGNKPNEWNPIIDNIQIQGRAVQLTPEPSTLALVGIAGGLGLARLVVRRRRQVQSV